MTAVVTQVPSLVACYADPHKLIPPLGLGAFPCLAFSSAALPNVPKVFNCGAPTQNFLTLIMSSITLPPPASLGGVVSGVFFGACRYKNDDVGLWLSTLNPKYVLVIKDDVILDYYVM